MSLQVYIDGACEPVNPGGTATYGVVVRHGTRTVFSHSGVVGSGKMMSNNVGEYSGLIAFLEWYIDERKGLDSGWPVVHSDSQLLVRQMMGQWRAKSGLYKSYYLKAQDLIKRHKLKLIFKWVPREQNEEADRLSKQALAEAGVEMRIQKE